MGTGRATTVGLTLVLVVGAALAVGGAPASAGAPPCNPGTTTTTIGTTTIPRSLQPTVTLAINGNRGADELRPTVTRRLEPGTLEPDPTVPYAELVADVGATGTCTYTGPVEVLYTFSAGLVPVGPTEASTAAGWTCSPPDLGISLTARCILAVHPPIPPGGSVSTLTYRADVGWDAVPETSAQALASFGSQHANAIDTIPVKASIVGMGDSYSSGEGSGAYTAGTAANGGCHRSTASWQHYWATSVLTGSAFITPPAAYTDGFRHVACSGAVSGDVLGDLPGPTVPESNQIAVLQSERDTTGVDAVLVSIGGNDALFSPIVTRCITDSDCQDDPLLAGEGTDRVTRRINALFPRMVTTFEIIRATTSPSGAADHDSAPVYVSGYPRLLPGTADAVCPSLLGLGQAERTWLRAKIADADTMLRAAAEAAGVHYLSVLPIFEGNQRCQPSDPAPAMNGIVNALGTRQLQESFHPTTLGFRLWGQAAVAAAPVPTANPAPGPVAPPTPVDDPLTSDDLEADNPDALGTPPATHVRDIFEGTDPAMITLDRFLPASDVSVRIYSDPVDLGTFPVDGNGQTTIEVPAGTAAGLGFGVHHLVVFGSGPTGQPREWILTLPVGPAPDGRIKKGTGPNRGDDIVNTTGEGQTSNGAASRGGSVTYVVSAQNDAPRSDRLRVTGSRSSGGFALAYFAGGRNVTSSVTAGTYRTPLLGPGRSQRIEVVATVRSNAAAGASLTASLTIRSDSDSNAKDKVKFVTRRR